MLKIDAGIVRAKGGIMAMVCDDISVKPLPAGHSSVIGLITYLTCATTMYMTLMASVAMLSKGRFRATTHQRRLGRVRQIGRMPITVQVSDSVPFFCFCNAKLVVN